MPSDGAVAQGRSWRLVRFGFPGRGPSLGVCLPGPAEEVADLGAVDPARFGSALVWLRRLRREGAAAAAELAQAAAQAPVVATLPQLEAALALLPPVEIEEVWAAGVTYERSRDARDREIQAVAAGQSPYDRVYLAERPELFFKATASRLSSPGGPVGLRADSRWQVPEPELGLVLDEDGAILGYTLGNDMSCRDIEGENALYLPQAKIFRCCCAVGPAVLVPPPSPAPEQFSLSCRVERGGRAVWEAETSTAHMRRSFAELAGYLRRHNWLPGGSVLLTGTGLVPPDEFALQDGDEIRISCPRIGTLRNFARPV